MGAWVLKSFCKMVKFNYTLQTKGLVVIGRHQLKLVIFIFTTVRNTGLIVATVSEEAIANILNKCGASTQLCEPKHKVVCIVTRKRTLIPC